MAKKIKYAIIIEVERKLTPSEFITLQTEINEYAREYIWQEFDKD